MGTDGRYLHRRLHGERGRRGCSGSGSAACTAAGESRGLRRAASKDDRRRHGLARARANGREGTRRGGCAESARPHLCRDWCGPCHICAGTWLRPCPHLHLDWGGRTYTDGARELRLAALTALAPGPLLACGKSHIGQRRRAGPLRLFVCFFLFPRALLLRASVSCCRVVLCLHQALRDGRGGTRVEGTHLRRRAMISGGGGRGLSHLPNLRNAARCEWKRTDTHAHRRAYACAHAHMHAVRPPTNADARTHAGTRTHAHARWHMHAHRQRRARNGAHMRLRAQEAMRTQEPACLQAALRAVANGCGSTKRAGGRRERELSGSRRGGSA